jgi:hypothetical protein
MSNGYYEDLNYELARTERFLQPDEEEDQEDEMSRVYLGPPRRGKFNEWVEEGPRRTRITEDWLIAQEDLRQAAVRSLRVSRMRRMRRAIVVWTLAMSLGAALLLGLVHVTLWFYEIVTR